MMKNEGKDGGVWAYCSVTSMFLIYFLVFGFCRSFSVLLVPFQQFYGLSAVTVNYIPGIFSLGIIIGGLTGSQILIKFGNRKTIIGSGIVIPLFHVLLYFVDHYWFALASFLIISIHMGLLFMAALNQISLYWEEKRTIATQIGSCGTSVGMLLFPPIIAWLIETYTVSGNYLVLSGIYLNIFIAAALTHFPEELKTGPEERIKFDMNIFKLPELYIYFLSQAMINGAYFSGMLYISPFAQSAYEINQVSAALLITTMGATELIFRIPIGILSDYKRINRHYILAINVINLGLSLLLMPLMKSYVGFGLVSIYSGIFQGGWGGLSFVTLSDFLKVYGLESQLMSCVGLSTALNGISCMVMSVGMGKVVELTGEYTMVFNISGGILIVAGVLSTTISILSNRTEAKKTDY